MACQKSPTPNPDAAAVSIGVMPQVVDDEHLILSQKILQHLAIYKDAEDLINIGAYSKGSNSSIDQAILYNSPIVRFLKQNVNDVLSFEEIVSQMKKSIQVEKVENK